MRKSFKKRIGNFRAAEEAIKKTNEELEKRVAERVEQLQQTEAQVRQLQKMDAIGTLAGGTCP